MNFFSSTSSAHKWHHVLGMIVAWAFVLCAGDRALYWMGSTVLNKAQFRYSQLFSGTLKSERVIVGNSRALHGFYSPELTKRTGQKTFNLAYNGLSAQEADFLVQTLIESKSPPKQMIFEVSNCFDSQPGVLIGFSPWRDKSSRLNALMNEYLPAESNIQKVFALSRLNGEIQKRSLIYLFKSDQDYIAPESRLISEKLWRNPGTETKLACTPKAIKAYQSITKQLRAANIDGLFVLAPYANLSDAEHEKVQAYLNEFQSVVGPSWKVLDMSRALGERNQFSDRIHTNKRGAIALIEKLETHL